MKRLIILLAAIMISCAGFAQSQITYDKVTARQNLQTNKIESYGLNDPDFEMIYFPDLQYMTQFYPAVLTSMFSWVVANQTSANLKAVIGGGDITQNGITSEFERADSNFDMLDAINIPYIDPPGNHDYNSNNPFGRNTALYNTYFGPARFTGKTWYGGNYGGKNENSWIKFQVLNQKFLVMGLEFCPPDSALNWANGILDSVYAADPERWIIITTHAHVSAFGEFSRDTTNAGPNTYGLVNDNSGEEVFAKFIRKHPKIFLVLNGHFRKTASLEGPNVKSFTEIGDHGNVIYQVLCNYQQDVAGGNGYFMRMKFKPSQRRIDLSFYSNYVGGFDIREPGFSLDFPRRQDNQSVGIAGGLYVDKEIRADSALSLANLPERRLVFTGKNGRLVSSNNFYIDSVNIRLGIGTLTPAYPLHVIGNVKVRDKILIDTNATLGTDYGLESRRYSIWRDSKDYTGLVNPELGRHQFNSSFTGAAGIADNYQRGNMISAIIQFSGTPPATVAGGREAIFGRNYMDFTGGTTVSIVNNKDFPITAMWGILRLSALNDNASPSVFNSGLTSPLNGPSSFHGQFIGNGGGASAAHVRNYNGWYSNFMSYTQISGASGSYMDDFAHFATTSPVLSGGVFEWKRMYGFYAHPVKTSSVTAAYGFYAAGTDDRNAFMGTVGVGTNAPVASAKVEIVSTTQGFLPPRMTAAQAGAISSPAEGLLVYVTDTDGTFTAKGWWGWDGSAWQKLNN